VPLRSAGILIYRRRPPRHTRLVPADGDAAPGARSLEVLEVLLVHPGGPYWARRDDGWWSIPKGEIADDEDPLAAAEREVEEELGHRLPGGERVALGEVVQAGGKHVVAWAARADLDAASARSGTFEMEWPPRSGQRRTFPEVDRAAWYGLVEARRKILTGQVAFLDRLEPALAQAVPPAASRADERPPPP
jgi:predicted NUDIX family NTP pyrophosphohydrolase